MKSAVAERHRRSTFVQLPDALPDRDVPSFINNEAPLWAFPPFTTSCGDNPFVEVGDPQGNGPDFDLFPTVEIPLRGFTYHLQDIAMLPWFSREVPSSAQNGWYDFPGTDQLTSPSVDCPAAP